MDSTPNNPNPWAPYNTYRDCSLGICSIYCPQWCYVVFPPPPPDDSSDDGSGGTYFSPLVIAVIGILASAFLLVTYYMLVTKYCRRRRWQDRDDNNQVSDIAGSAGDDHNGTARTATAGLDESVIKSITVYKYQRLEGLVDGTDCSVCLSEFAENESLRLLPKCNHAFHVPCIDKWLKSHSSCPLCRSNIATLGDLPPPQPSRVAPYQPAPPTTTISINTSSLARCDHQMADSPVLVIRDDQRLSVPVESRLTGQEAGIMRRSVSLNSTICGHVIAIASTSDHRGHIENRNLRFSIGIETLGLPNGTELNNPIGTNDSVSASPMEMKRSTSTGRFMLGRCGSGQVKNWVMPR